MFNPRMLLVAVLLASALIPLAPPTPALAQSSPATVTFDGGGFGHAIGMSQYGAYGLAVDNNSAFEIVDFYYTGIDPLAQHTNLFTSPHPLGAANPNIWIGLLQNKTSVTFEIGPGGTVDLCQNGDNQGDCPREDAVPESGEIWKLARVSGQPTRCFFERVDPAPTATTIEGDCKASVTWGGADQAEYIEVDGVEYRYGVLRFRQGIEQKQAGTFHTSLDLSVEEYLLGLREVPLSWPAAALEAQVLTARTYGLEKFTRYYDALESADEGFLTEESGTPYRRSACYCHLYNDTYDQNYRGMENETLNPSSYPSWDAAVAATAGQVITHTASTTPKMIQAFYSSSTGGFTENSEYVFVTALPYLKSVADPWSGTSANSLASWSKTISVDKIASVYGFSEITNVTLASAAPNAQMTITGTKSGSNVTLDVSIAKKYGSLGLLAPSVSGVTYHADGTVPDPSDLFTDISGSVHKADINEIGVLRITLGCNPPDNTLFCPLNSVTRGQMAAFLNRALKLPAATGDIFTDDETSIFEDDINRLVSVAGTDLACSAGKFCANEFITRAEMALFLQRTLDLQATGETSFVDAVGNPYEAEINILGDTRISLGCNPPTNDEFCPDRTVLRQEMASFLVRAIAFIGG